MSRSRASHPPADLIAAFKASESPSSIAVLMIQDGFDAVSMRVLAAWQHVKLSWRAPEGKQPDNGRPTPAAWQWICRGLQVDFVALAEAADVVQLVAREKARMLLGARLVYPDNTLARSAQAALNELVRSRLFPDGTPDKNKDKEKKAAAKKAKEPDSPDDVN